MCDTAVRLRFEIERLREALQPFAQFAKEFDEKVYPPEDDVTPPTARWRLDVA